MAGGLVVIWFVVFFAGIAMSTLLVAHEMFGRVPVKVRCHCSMVKSPLVPQHFVSGGQFVQAVGCVTVTLLMFHDLLRGFSAGVALGTVIWLASTVVQTQFWRKHRKNRRKRRMLKRALSKLKVTAAGIRVVPVRVPAPGAAFAGSLALCAALTGCSESAGAAEPAPAPSSLAPAEGWTFVWVPTREGFSVPCLVYKPFPGTPPGISCDWRQEYRR